MFSVQPSHLTDKELVRYADQLLAQGQLTKEWQEEIIKRFEQLIHDERRSDWR
jgi:Ni,Fe-hydrogenase III small subunit